MKNNLKYITLDNFRINNSKKQMGYTNLKRNKDNNSKLTAPQNSFLKKSCYFVYPTIEQETSTKKILKHFHNNINLTSRKYYASYNKDDFNNKIKVILPEGNSSNNNFNNKNKISLKPFALHSELKEYISNKTILNNNNEDNQYPTNYSYYEYKYIKKKKKEKKYNISNKNNVQINSRYNTRTPNEYSNNISFTSTNNKLNRSTIIANQNTIHINRDEIERSPIRKKSSKLPEYSYRNAKIKTLISSPSDDNKKIKNINPNFIQRNIQTINRYNFELNKEKNKPPRTPSFDSKNRIHNKLNQLLKENYNDKNDIKNNINKEDEIKNTNNKNVGEGHKVTKIFFIPPKRKYTVKDESHISISDENKNIVNKSNIYEVEFIKNKEKKSLSSNNTILHKSEKYNNNVTISIKDSKEKKNIVKKKIDFKTPLRSKAPDNLVNSNIEMTLNYNNKGKDLIKVNKNLFDEKIQKNPINKIKLLNSNKFKYFTLSKNQ